MTRYILSVYAFLILNISSFILIGCRKFCNQPPIHFFKIPALVSPGIDSIKIGDTLTLSISSNSSMVDYITGHSGTTVNFGSASLKGFFSIFLLKSGNDSTYPAGSNFKISAPKGRITTHDSKNIDFDFIEEFGNYVFNASLIPNTKGIYLLYFNGGGGARDCEHASYLFYTKNKESHLHYLKESYHVNRPITAADSTQSYCFKVY